MKLEALRPEQRDLIQCLLWTLRIKGMERDFLQEEIADVVAHYDSCKDALLELADHHRPNLVVLYRGGAVWKRLNPNEALYEFRIDGALGNPDVEIVHRERLRMDARMSFDQAAMVTVSLCVERFKRFGHACASCGTLHYHSANYMELPEWLYRDEFDTKYGFGAWERNKAMAAGIAAAESLKA